MGAAVFIATVAAGVRMCGGDRVADAFYSLSIPQPRKPGALTPVLVPGSFPLLISVHRATLCFVARKLKLEHVQTVADLITPPFPPSIIHFSSHECSI